MQETGEKLDFEKADFGGAEQRPACAVCQTPIAGTYYTANGRVVCERCKEGLDARPQGFDAAGFVRGALLGAGVAAVGTVVWWAVATYLHIELGLLSIAIGIFVGKAVQLGAGHRSGRSYQVLAVLLTYLSIVGAYAPAIIEGLGEKSSSGAVLLIMLIAPFLGGFENIIGILIIGFGLYEAWRYAHVGPIEVAGPYEMK